jgi:hypothetical protein
MLIFFQLAYSAKLKKLMYLCKENYRCQKLQHLVHSFPVAIELFFLKAIVPGNDSFQGLGRIILLQIGVFR